MKKTVILIIFLTRWFYSDSQNRSNVWELSYEPDTLYPNCEIRFDSGIADAQYVYRPMSFFFTNSSICDTNGNLLFYTNGLTIGNKNYDTLQNAVNFNPGGATDFYEPLGMGTCQGVVIIPNPGNPEQYYLFHETGEFFIAYNTLELQPLHLSYSVIDMNLDGGLGGIIDSLKNVHIIEDTLTWGGLTACKHANGRDWWIIFHRFYSDKYYKLLVTPNGIAGPYEQEIGSVIKYDVDVEANFSPDGSKFCFSNHGGWLDYMNFDRCTGEFSNCQTAWIPDSNGVFGSSFSPNGRFIYSSSLINLYQYDTWDSNMIANVIHVAAFDSFYQYTIPVYFSMHQLAPDNKIYIGPGNGVSYLNVINSPDSLGTTCDFTPHSFEMPFATYTNSIPNFPNYDLGPMTGSLCDTLYLPTPFTFHNSNSFKVYPNPADHWLNIIYDSNEDALFEMFDTYGKRVEAISLFRYFKNRLLNISDLPAGVYFAAVTQKGKRIWTEKVIVAH